MDAGTLAACPPRSASSPATRAATTSVTARIAATIPPANGAPAEDHPPRTAAPTWQPPRPIRQVFSLEPPLDYSLCASLGELSRRLASCFVIRISRFGDRRLAATSFLVPQNKLFRVKSNEFLGAQKLTSGAEDNNSLSETRNNTLH